VSIIIVVKGGDAQDLVVTYMDKENELYPNG